MTGETILVGDVQLDVAVHGAGEPILFLHAEDGAWHADQFVEHLAKGSQVHVPHHPGWGSSSRPQYIEKPSDIALVYTEYLDGLRQPMHIVGASFGGWVAAEMAILRHPLIRSVSLIAPTGMRFGPPDSRTFADIYVLDDPGRAAVLYGDPASAPTLEGRSDDYYLYLAAAQEAVARYCWAPYMYNRSLYHQLRRVDAPALVVSGDEDRFALLPRYYEEYSKLLGEQGAKHVVISGGGHRLEEERPADTASEVRQFIEQIH